MPTRKSISHEKKVFTPEASPCWISPVEQKNGMIIAAPKDWDETCFAVPAIRALAHSGLATALVCSAEQSTFWQSACELPQIHFSKKTTPSALLTKIGQDHAGSLTWENGIAAKAFAKAKITKRLGPDLRNLTKLLTHPLALTEGPTEHRVRMYLKTCELMGIPAAKPEYFAPANLALQPQPKTILLSPDSDFGPSHEWPLNRWQDLAEQLLEKGNQITIASLSTKRDLGKILAQNLNQKTDFLLPTSLPHLAAHQLVIAADSSLPHLAAHAGTTCVTLFGPNDPAWKRPLGTRHVVVRKAVECSPCLSEKCLLDHRCLGELSVSQILAAIPTNLDLSL